MYLHMIRDSRDDDFWAVYRTDVVPARNADVNSNDWEIIGTADTLAEATVILVDFLAREQKEELENLRTDVDRKESLIKEHRRLGWK